MFKVVPQTLLLLAILAAPAVAESSKDKWCRSFAETAEVVMQGRQSGLGLQYMLDTLLKGVKGQAAETAKQIVLAAYSVPKYHSDDMQVEATNRFRDDFLLKCLTE